MVVGDTAAVGGCIWWKEKVDRDGGCRSELEKAFGGSSVIARVQCDAYPHR